MNTSNPILHATWRAHTWQRHQDGWLVTSEANCPRTLLAVDSLLRELGRRRAGYLLEVATTKAGHQSVKLNQFLKELLHAICTLNTSEVRSHFPAHRFSPYFELWEKAAPEIRWFAAKLTIDAVPVINAWLEEMRASVRTAELTAPWRNARRGAMKNYRALRRYIDGLFVRHSRLLVVRVDVGYWDWRGMQFEHAPVVTPHRMKKDFARLLRYIGEKMLGPIGYCWKIEYGATKGLHAHILVFFDAHELRDDVSLGFKIRDEWVQITEGRGTGWNCNADKSQLEMLGICGLGDINYHEMAKRRNLDNCAAYLTKTDAYVRYVGQGIGKTFGKGRILPHVTQRGRPRKYEPWLGGIVGSPVKP